MSDTPEVFDLSSVRLGVWMGGSEEGNAGHGLYSEVAPGLFDLILLGDRILAVGDRTLCVTDVTTVVLDPNGKTASFWSG